MKKLLISAAFGIVGFVGLSNGAQRSVLIEEFSTYTCPYCPYAIRAVDSLKKVYGDTVTVIQYVQGPSGSESSFRFNYYAIYYVPTTWIDGVVADTGGSTSTFSILRGMVESRKTVPSPIVIDSMDFYISYDTGYVSVDISLENDLNSSNTPRIFCVITERHVRANSNGTYAYHLMRDIASPPTGENLTAMNAGDHESFNWSFPVASNWVADSLEAAFFIQYYNTKEALQAGQMPVRFVNVGEGLASKPQLDLRTGSHGLVFNLPDAGSVDLVLYDVSGRSVATLASGAFSQGEHTVALPDLSHGVYTAVLRFENNTRTLKIVR